MLLDFPVRSSGAKERSSRKEDPGKGILPMEVASVELKRSTLGQQGAIIHDQFHSALEYSHIPRVFTTSVGTK